MEWTPETQSITNDSNVQKGLSRITAIRGKTVISYAGIFQLTKALTSSMAISQLWMLSMIIALPKLVKFSMWMQVKFNMMVLPAQVTQIWASRVPRKYLIKIQFCKTGSPAVHNWTANLDSQLLLGEQRNSIRTINLGFYRFSPIGLTTSL